jgi:uncharacterized protein (TIGR00730 family)
MRSLSHVCVFCGSNVGNRSLYRESAHELGTALGQAGIGLVFGGGKVGLMGVVADAVMAQGQQAVGIIPAFLSRKEVAHASLSRLEVVDSMHTRKARMAALSDGFVALPGGFGTLDELAEILTWAQLGLHPKPVVVWNVAGFFTPLIQWLDHAVAEGFLRAENRDLLAVADSLDGVLQALRHHQVPVKPKWMHLDEV